MTSNVEMEDQTGAAIFQLESASASEMTEHLTEAQKKLQATPFVAVAVLVAVGAALSQNPVLGAIVAVLGAVALFYVNQWDRGRRTVVAFYDVNDELAVAYQHLVDSFHALTASKRTRQVTSSGSVHDLATWKSNSGASSLVKVAELKLAVGGPSVMTTNIAVPSFTSGRSTYLLPDRILVRDGGHYADIPYNDLSAEFEYVRFIETERVPSDALVVGETYTYVNKSGGPDRRYKTNPVLKVTRMAYLTMTGRTSGWHAVWQFSRLDAAEAFAKALDAHARASAALKQEPVAPIP